jgi:membrane protease YdiL (CAAX protease family)
MIRRFVKEHQLIFFFGFTYLATWLLLLPFLLTGNEQAYGILVLIGIFCPAFVSIIISRVHSPAPKQNPRSRRRITFLVTWAVATVIFTLNVQTTSGIESPIAVVFYAIVGLLPAFVMASVFSKFPAIRKSLTSLINPKGHMGWYLFALLIIPIIRLISIPITHQLGLDPIYEPDRIDELSRLIGLVAVSFLYGFVFTGGLNEETGWTGFALPRLQAGYSPLIASIILWFLWILWHMPMQIAGFWNSDPASFIRALIGTFFARFIFTWLYNKTKGGILAPMLFHVSANVSFSFLPVTHAHMVLEACLAIFIIFMAGMWKKLPDSHSGVFGATEVPA